ncbi:hypothetical protein OE88DRAFT_1736536 [Heliocybe sulcata]|uniref:Uncharacterized protein n=1 Tax=Heliocybe sulcata TaxID=5364 RepID=A0A5C3MVJ5_9AGAM|nr:hypothetical protein OE88DRAFT_1736536 [Heliocybe sulcata]
MSLHTVGLGCMAVLALLVVSVKSAPVDVPVICVKATWRDLCLFILTNYVTHVATTLSTPGGRWYDGVAWKTIAVLFPFASLGRSMEMLSRWLSGAGWKDDIRSAWGRGALVVVARTSDWTPGYGRSQGRVLAKVSSTWHSYHYAPDQHPSSYETATVWVEDMNVLSDEEQIKYRNIHGRMGELPKGFTLAFCQPPNGREESIGLPSRWSGRLDLVYNDPVNANIELSHTRNWMAMVVSVVQLFASAITLYRSRGDQIDRYGYAAFGLSVIPFMLMSLLNLVLNAVLGEYPYLYVLRTGVLKESEFRLGAGARYEGPVGYHTDIACRDPNAARVKLHLEEGRGGGSEVLVVKVGPYEKKFKFIPAISVEVAETAKHCILVHPIANRLGLVQSLDREHQSTLQEEKYPWKYEDEYKNNWTAFCSLSLWSFVTAASCFIAPYMIIYGLTRFEKNDSTVSERAWMMGWLAVGNWYGLRIFAHTRNKWRLGSRFMFGLKKSDLLEFILCTPAAIGGYIQLAKMYISYGSCSLAPS